ncbi:MAG: TonB-dependent siderophore receptor [Alteromonas sp.]|uniref:TonB-dependent receptor n=1 Tax=unclassified Alteromonas TaxID=2614992 RepID=UPI0009036797|nr:MULTISPECIES: TonB-dependent siderophore receptor [unclassified Alteromonas]APE07256.1 TonB-dependent receptor [Alteromonas sp. RW2A1]AUC89883.1 TonB-dependent siderophore receptor [Alteromonas sp. MB-3u-76]MAI65525.1 TonB-dependent siderophore receptor [Alteromonas sp.]
MKFKPTTIATAVMLSPAALGVAMEDIERLTVEGKYLSVNQSNSIKSPTPIIDVPQSLSIMTAEEITARGITSVGQIIDYTPGVNTSQGEGHRDAVVFRGVRSTADFYIDGNRDDVQYYRALYNVEQVEILRGPNALLFGRGGTGGILNRVSKKATIDQQFVNYNVSANTFGAYSLQLDTNIDTGEDSAVRINAMYESLDNHRDFFYGDRYGFNPTARFQLSEDTIVDLSYEYIDHERFIDRGVPTGANGEPVEAFENIVFGDPENNYQTLEADVFRANLQHNFSDNLKGNFNAFYGDYDKVYANFYAADFDPETNVATLDGYIDGTERENLILSANLVGEFATGSIEHTVIFGGEFINTESDQNRLNSVFDSNGDDQEDFLVSGPLDFRGLTGTNAAGNTVTTAFTDLNDDTRVDLDVYSFYVQDEIALSENFDLVLGARFDSFDIEVFDARPEVLETRNRTDEEVSPRAGLVYKPQENISIYASYSESFLPRSGEQYANINGDANRLDPDTFTNQEIGVKWDFADSMSFTAAIFENEQTSLDNDPNDPEGFVEVDSDVSGFELQLQGYITDKWFVTANYSNLDGENANGVELRELPENTMSVWTTYQVSDVLGFGIGATYQDESFVVTATDSPVLPSYTRVDASAYYELNNGMRLQLNVENLTDTLYFPNAHSRHQATVGAPINARLSVIGSF